MVVRDVVPHTIVEPLRKLVPVTVIVNCAAPAETVFGESEVTVGPLTFSVTPGDTAVDVFRMVTLWAPGVVREPEETVAVMEVAVPAVTVNWVEPK